MTKIGIFQNLDFEVFVMKDAKRFSSVKLEDCVASLLSVPKEGEL
jgi:hypothetical protein